MVTKASNRNVGLWRNITNAKIENLGIQLYPCGFTNYFNQLPLYHTHRYHELFFISVGVTEVATLNGTYRFSAGECFIVPAGVPHYRRDASADGVDLTFDLRFSVFRAADAGESALDLYTPMQNLLEYSDDLVVIPNGGCLHHFVKAINTEHMEMQPFSELKLKAYLTALFVDANRLLFDGERAQVFAQEGSRTVEKPDDLRVAIDFQINRRFGNPPLTIEELADLLHLSVRQTERTILKMYGKTYKRKIMEVRLKNARMILRSTNASVADVAKFCGYSTHSGLIKAFTEEFGITPTEYRESFRET